MLPQYSYPPLFNLDEFGTERVARLTYPEIEQRFVEFRRMTSFEHLHPPGF